MSLIVLYEHTLFFPKDLCAFDAKGNKVLICICQRGKEGFSYMLAKGKRDFNCTGIFREGIEQLNWDFNEGKGKKTELEVGEIYNVLMQTLSQQNVHFGNMYSCILLILA